MNYFSDLILFLFCLLGSGFFEGMETGVISLNRMRLRHLAESGDRVARILQNFLQQPDRLLGVTLVGTNICAIIASVISANWASRMHPWLQPLITIATTLIILIFSTYLPKAWFQSRPMERCRPFAIPLRWSAIILRPLINSMNWVTNWIVPSHTAPKATRALVATKDEIDFLAQESADHGALSPRQRIMIRRVLELSTKTAGHIMTTRRNMAIIPASANMTALMTKVRESAHTRLPVCEEDGKTIKGTINFFDVMAGSDEHTEGSIKPFVRPALFIQETTPLMETFAKLRLSKQSMCLVVNANSEVTGLITNQNVLQAIVGKI
jgi:CBS domain containing-hemolysin-like protein